MSGSGRAGNGRGNSHRRPFRRRDKNYGAAQEGEVSRDGRPSAEGNFASGRNSSSDHQARQYRGGSSRRNNENPRGERVPFVERPKWIPPKMNTDPLPVPDCPWCGKPIRDISQAIADRDSGAPVHFDCVAARIAEGERLEKGEVITYIGGGRFGIVSFSSQASPRASQDRGMSPAGHGFEIKKIIEWESKEKKAEWRDVICDHYSVT